MTLNRSFLAGQVKALDGQSPHGDFEVVLSAPSLDRDGEVIDSGAFEPLPKHITFDVDHGMSTQTTVGSGTPTYEDGRLVVRGTFASIPRAQEVRALVNEGHIRATSVAFMAPKIEVKDGVRHIVKAELLNGAFVAVPANRDAVVLAAKGLALEASAQPGLKAIEGSYEERRSQLADAVRAANPGAWWTYVIATFDDSVVYEVEGRGAPARYQADYTIAEGVVSLTNVREVDVVEVIQPKDNAESEPAPEKAAAPAPAASPAAARPALALAYLAEAEALLV